MTGYVYNCFFLQMYTFVNYPITDMLSPLLYGNY